MHGKSEEFRFFPAMCRQRSNKVLKWAATGCARSGRNRERLEALGPDPSERETTDHHPLDNPLGIRRSIAVHGHGQTSAPPLPFHRREARGQATGKLLPHSRYTGAQYSKYFSPLYLSSALRSMVYYGSPTPILSPLS